MVDYEYSDDEFLQIYRVGALSTPTWSSSGHHRYCTMFIPFGNIPYMRDEIMPSAVQPPVFVFDSQSDDDDDDSDSEQPESSALASENRDAESTDDEDSDDEPTDAQMIAAMNAASAAVGGFNALDVIASGAKVVAERVEFEMANRGRSHIRGLFSNYDPEESRDRYRRRDYRVYTTEIEKLTATYGRKKFDYTYSRDIKLGHWQRDLLHQIFREQHIRASEAKRGIIAEGPICLAPDENSAERRARNAERVAAMAARFAGEPLQVNFLRVPGLHPIYDEPVEVEADEEDHLLPAQLLQTSFQVITPRESLAAYIDRNGAAALLHQHDRLAAVRTRANVFATNFGHMSNQRYFSGGPSVREPEIGFTEIIPEPTDDELAVDNFYVTGRTRVASRPDGSFDYSERNVRTTLDDTTGAQDPTSAHQGWPLIISDGVAVDADGSALPRSRTNPRPAGGVTQYEIDESILLARDAAIFDNHRLGFRPARPVEDIPEFIEREEADISDWDEEEDGIDVHENAGDVDTVANHPDHAAYQHHNGSALDNDDLSRNIGVTIQQQQQHHNAEDPSDHEGSSSSSSSSSSPSSSSSSSDNDSSPEDENDNDDGSAEQDNDQDLGNADVYDSRLAEASQSPPSSLPRGPSSYHSPGWTIHGFSSSDTIIRPTTPFPALYHYEDLPDNEDAPHVPAQFTRIDAQVGRQLELPIGGHEFTTGEQLGMYSRLGEYTRRGVEYGNPGLAHHRSSLSFNVHSTSSRAVGGPPFNRDAEQNRHRVMYNPFANTALPGYQGMTRTITCMNETITTSSESVASLRSHFETGLSVTSEQARASQISLPSSHSGSTCTSRASSGNVLSGIVASDNHNNVFPRIDDTVYQTHSTTNSSTTAVATTAAHGSSAPASASGNGGVAQATGGRRRSNAFIFFPGRHRADFGRWPATWEDSDEEEMRSHF